VFCVSVKVKLFVYCKVLTYRSIVVFVCILPEKAVPKMTYTVSGGMLNPTHSLTHSLTFLGCSVRVGQKMAQFFIR